jgi:protein-tyrosine phosphatase
VSQSFCILTVCTGNIGRSPMAERLLDHRLRERLGDDSDRFAATSAGTEGLTGHPMEEFAASALTELGVSPAGFRARLLEPKVVAAADLILTATREHRAAVVRLSPQAVRTTFTLNEFARLAQPVNDALGSSAAAQPDSPQGNAAARADLAGRLRGVGERPDPDNDDIQDPLGAPLETYRALAGEIDWACLRAVDLLLGPLH